jgi:hypothetical protein
MKENRFTGLPPYMPASTLHIDAQNPVADESAYTVIVVHRLQLFSGPNLVLNTNYGASDVPVPKGVGPLSSSISLVQGEVRAGIKGPMQIVSDQSLTAAL